MRLRNLRFELLFEMGVYALHDGYTREAVSSCAAALERFYEFYVAVTAEASNVGPEELALAWKAVSRQSERQLGMFVAAHLILTGSAPELLNPNSHVRFRNSVVHQGYVPEHHEAEEFCEVLLGMLDRLIDDLRGRCPIPLNSIYERFLPPELEERPRLKQTPLARAQCQTIRLKLLKIGVQVRLTVRHVWISMSEAYPYSEVFAAVVRNLQAIPLRC